VPFFSSTDMAHERYFDKSFEDQLEKQMASKYIPTEEVGIRYIVIPSDSDIIRIGALSDNERELVDELKWRLTHRNNSHDDLEVVALEVSRSPSEPVPSSLLELNPAGLIALFTDLRRGYENFGRPGLRFGNDQDPFLYPRIAVFELFEKWRADQIPAHKKDIQLTENVLGPLVLELFKRYRHRALDAFCEPILRNHVLRSLGAYVPERLFAGEIRDERFHAIRASKENWVEPQPEFVFSMRQAFWLAMMSDGVRNHAREILNFWWKNSSVLRTCTVCRREFTLIDRWCGVEMSTSAYVHLTEDYFDNLCLKCPIVGNQFTSLETVNNELRAVTDDTLFHEALKEYIDVCGFVPMRPIFPSDPTLFQRIDKANYVRFLKAWGAIGGPEEGVTGWIPMLLAYGLFPGEAVKTARGYWCLADDGALCRSLDEKLIDDLLSRLEKKHVHEPDYPHDKQFNPNGRKRADWKVGEVYVEYFGMMSVAEYAEKANQKQTLAEKHGLKLLSVYPQDMIDMTGEKLSSMLDAAGLI
jgi:hypothetical protein